MTGPVGYPRERREEPWVCRDSQVEGAQVGPHPSNPCTEKQPERRGSALASQKQGRESSHGTQCSTCSCSVESMGFRKALAPHLSSSSLVATVTMSGNHKWPAPSHPHSLFGCQDGNRLRTHRYIPEVLLTIVVPFPHLAGSCSRPRQQSVPQTGE